MSVIIEGVLRAPVGLPAVPAGREAASSCSPGCRVLGIAREAVDTPLHAPVLQPYVKGMHRHHHTALDRLCAAEGVELRPDDHSKLIGGGVWHLLASGEMHRHHSQEEICILQDDHCDCHSEELCILLSL